MIEMKILRILKNYLCYCGINREEYNKIKKDAYVSNFRTWRILHCLMSVVFATLFISSLFDDLLSANTYFYLSFMLYSIISAVVFFFMNEKSLIAQFWIYLSISLLLLIGCFLTLTNVDHPSITFIVMLIITPLFMVDKPFYMGIVLVIASVIYLVWMYGVKDPLIWKMDLVNVITFSFSGFLIHILLNSIRIKEFVLARKLTIQKDIDDLTGLKNKGALTREINEYLQDVKKNKGILFILDIDNFKNINDTYGHDVGDDVIGQVGKVLNDSGNKCEIVGRFGGDEFIFFKKESDQIGLAKQIAEDIILKVSQQITLPDKDSSICASIGIAIYHGKEKNYSELFKKADIALYDLKSNRAEHYKIFDK